VQNGGPNLRLNYGGFEAAGQIRTKVE
jgi:hypothetical protein